MASFPLYKLSYICCCCSSSNKILLPKVTIICGNRSKRKRSSTTFPFYHKSNHVISNNTVTQARKDDEIGAVEEEIATKDYVTVGACFVGLLTGVSVVLFNISVHELRDFLWDGLPSRGASWIREEPLDLIWKRVILVPVCGGITVSMINILRNYLEPSSKNDVPESNVKAALRPILKTLAAVVTLGTGNSLGPEGPSVEIGSAISKGIGHVFEWKGGRKLSLLASGSAAGISSELPLYLLLGILCGMVSLALSWCTSYALKLVDNFHKTTGISTFLFPAFGGLFVGLTALVYPEVLYWGFENVDSVLESRPVVNSLPVSILIQLVGVKIIATSLCRASGLVGGYYAPSLFIGAATGMAYGKVMGTIFVGPDSLFNFSIIEVASPQAYGLVGMAATLAGVCQVPLTSVLLLFELTQDYRIVLPLLGAVGLSSWFTSSMNRMNDSKENMDKNNSITNQNNIDTLEQNQEASETSDTTDLCKLESSLCVYDSDTDVSDLTERITVSQAMKIRYVTVQMNTSIAEAVSLMLVEKQSCVLITGSDNFLVGLLALEDIQEFCKVAMARDMKIEVDKLCVSDLCKLEGNNCHVRTVTPEMTLVTAEKIMDLYGINQLPVVSHQINNHDRGCLIGLLDRECISIVCRAIETKEFLTANFITKRAEISP